MAIPGLLALGCIAGSVAAGVQFGTDNAQQTLGIIGAGLALAAMSLIRSTPKALVVLGIYLGIVDGYLKLSTGSAYATFGRDVVLVGLISGAVWRSVIVRQTAIRLPPLGLAVIAFAGLVVVQVLNPDAHGAKASVAGLRQHIEFVPLFFLAYAAIRETKHLRVVLVVFLIAGAANGVVSGIQSQLTPQQLAQWGPGYQERIEGTGVFKGAGRVANSQADGVDKTRTFGLGSDAGAGGFFAMFGLIAGVGLMLVGDARLRLLVILLAAPVLVGVLTSGARATVIATYAAVVGFGALTAISRRAVRVLVACSLMGVVVFGAVSAVVSQRSNAAVERQSSVTPGKALDTYRQERLGSLQLLPQYVREYPLGVGLATAGPSARVRATGADAPLRLNSENEFNFLLIEVGLPGLVALLGFTVLVVTGSLRVRKLEGHEDRILLAAVLAPIFGVIASFFGSPVTAAPPIAPYLWFVGGIVSFWLLAGSKTRA